MESPLLATKRTRSGLAIALLGCAKKKDMMNGSRLHAYILKEGLFGKDLLIDNNLVNMYAKCGGLDKAQQVFNELRVRSSVSWNALITGYAQNGHGKEALDQFGRMQLECWLPNAVTFNSTLKACANTGISANGKKIHAQIIGQELLENNILIGNTLVDMYAKCGVLAQAQQVFKKLLVRNVISYNSVIGGCTQHMYHKEALSYYETMKCEEVTPDAVTFLGLLKACGSIGAIDKGEEIHLEISNRGLLGKNSSVGTALLDMYVKCGALAKAQKVFDELLVQDQVSWTVMISGYCEHGYVHEALNCFEQMILDGHTPDAVTFSCILKVCGSIGDIEKGEEIHSAILNEGLLTNNKMLGTALIDMYVKCGELTKARTVFHQLDLKDTITLTALIMGYARHGYSDEAIDHFEQT